MSYVRRVRNDFYENDGFKWTVLKAERIAGFNPENTAYVKPYEGIVFEWYLGPDPKNNHPLVFTSGAGNRNWFGRIENLESVWPRNRIIREMVEISDIYHLNTMNSGTERQWNFLNQRIFDRRLRDSDGRLINEWYPEACKILKEYGLYEIQYKGKKVKFGHAWFEKPIPKLIQNRILSWEERINSGLPYDEYKLIP